VCLVKRLLDGNMIVPMSPVNNTKKASLSWNMSYLDLSNKCVDVRWEGGL
jgi:hypothetical protein